MIDVGLHIVQCTRQSWKKLCFVVDTYRSEKALAPLFPGEPSAGGIKLAPVTSIYHPPPPPTLCRVRNATTFHHSDRTVPVSLSLYLYSPSLLHLPPLSVLQVPCFALACSSIPHQDLGPHPSIWLQGLHTVYPQDIAHLFSTDPSFFCSFHLLHCCPPKS